MTLYEPIVEDAALEWFVALVPRLREVGHGPQLAPSEPVAERGSFGGVVLVGLLREAIRRVASAIPAEARATNKEFLSVPRHMERRLKP